MLGEQSEIMATLDQHREQRKQWLTEGGRVERIIEQQEIDKRLKLRAEELEAQLPAIREAVEQERRAAWEAAWEAQRPELAAAETELARATQAFHAALGRSNELHVKLACFGERLREYARPPPLLIYNDWSLREYVRAVECRQQSGAPQLKAELALSIEAPLHLPPAARFLPRRVPISEIEAISAIAPPRRIHVLHGPVKTSNLNVGIARMFAGEAHSVPARAAYALVASGCAVYLDDETATATAA